MVMNQNIMDKILRELVFLLDDAITSQMILSQDLDEIIYKTKCLNTILNTIALKYIIYDMETYIDNVIEYIDIEPLLLKLKRIIIAC
jgi:hypothetical protein